MNFKNHKYANKGFNDGQVKALIVLEKFYNDPKELSITLCGAAGTGKTYILKHFLDNIARHSVCVTAPTHKAGRILERMTGRKSKTLQSLHGLRPNVNLDFFNIDNVKFDALGEALIKNYYAIIVDESSMINASLYNLNMLRAKQYNVKVIYVGEQHCPQ